MKNNLILFALAIMMFTGCSKYCEPGNISNGKSLQHHDQKKFHSMIRVMWSKQYGSFCKVRYGNMKTIADRIYENCGCKKFVEGTWVREDSI